MKRLMIGLALLALGTVAHAQQSVCVSFAPGGFCDGLEVTFTPGVSISGTWQNYDCTGVDASLTASIPRGDGEFRFICSNADCATAQVFGWDVLVLDLDAPIQVLDLFGVVGGQILLDLPTPVEITPGACPFNPQREGGRAFLDSLR